MPPAGAIEATTEGALLGGRLSYRQFRHGYRTGIEPVLLAASVPAHPAQRVLDAGCGAGAALLCLAARVPGLAGVGLEADVGTASLARHNWSANGFSGFVLHQVRLPDLPEGIGQFDHVFANPPWHRGDASASSDTRRDLARRASPELLERWITVLASLLRPGGSLTLIVPAASHARASAAMAGLAGAGGPGLGGPGLGGPGLGAVGLGGLGLGGVALLPLWPKQGMPAKIVLLQGRRGARTDGMVHAGLVLHHAGGRYTEAAERVLREGEALELGR